ncbi:MAG: 2-oxoacid:ferredoxin oxidoreductase subunit beta [Myxococcales bacterium]|nr:2-oxoacid:ferredoxin oxidoreductase subunit beta [Myxococcales bacterium]
MNSRISGQDGRLPVLTKKDYQSDEDVRWCPGCGDYAILAQVQKVFAELQLDPDKTVFVSGIGCSSRFPYYMNTYGLHGIHGRAPAIATGLKIARPDLDVWMVTGDGDGLSIGGNHFIHLLRRNVGLKVLLFNNRIYGLTKGQYSPTSEVGKKSPSTPFGSPDEPFNPLAVAIGAGASFVARTVDTDVGHLQGVLKRAAAHQGTALVEILQNCNVFNDLTFEAITGREHRADRQLLLEPGQPLVFGKNRDRGIRFRNDGAPEIVKIGDGADEVPLSALPVHDEADAAARHAFTMAQFDYPELPVAMGVLRAVERPVFETVLRAQEVTARKGAPKPNGDGQRDLEALWNQGDVWDAD